MIKAAARYLFRAPSQYRCRCLDLLAALPERWRRNFARQASGHRVDVPDRTRRVARLHQSGSTQRLGAGLSSRGNSTKVSLANAASGAESSPQSGSVEPGSEKSESAAISRSKAHHQTVVTNPH